MKDQDYFMKEALKEALKAIEINEVPVGAVIVKDNEIIARAHNIRETKQVSTYHAEILAIEKACKKLGTWRLVGCEMYVTLEPCVMCSGALVLSRIEKVLFGAFDKKAGAVVSIANALDNELYNHHVNYEGGILKKESAKLLKDFFKRIRNQKKFDK